MKELKNKKIGKWTIIEKVDSKDYMARWLCRCECGKEKIVYQKHLLSGSSKSCGCYRDKITSARMKLNNPTIRKHCMSNSRLYGVWSGMKHRCYNSNASYYEVYGGRGIEVCDEWQDFNSFKEWALSNGYSDVLTLDRINVNGNYEPSNCRWITIQEQQYNKRTNHLITYNGKTQTVTEWADEIGINRNTLFRRLDLGWSIGRALGYE